MYRHARFGRAPDDIFCSAAAWKRHDQIGLAFVEHPLIAQWASFFAEFVPFALRETIRLARDAPARRPSISYPVSAARVSVVSCVTTTGSSLPMSILRMNRVGAPRPSCLAKRMSLRPLHLGHTARAKSSRRVAARVAMRCSGTMGGGATYAERATEARDVSRRN